MYDTGRHLQRSLEAKGRFLFADTPAQHLGPFETDPETAKLGSGKFAERILRGVSVA